MALCKGSALDLASLSNLRRVDVKISKFFDDENCFTDPIFGHTNWANLLLIVNELLESLSAATYEYRCCNQCNFSLNLIDIVLQIIFLLHCVAWIRSKPFLQRRLKSAKLKHVVETVFWEIRASKSTSKTCIRHALAWRTPFINDLHKALFKNALSFLVRLILLFVEPSARVRKQTVEDKVHDLHV